MHTNFVKFLKEREMIHDITPTLENHLANQFVSGYVGFDLTATSLHIGNLASIMLLRYLQVSAHKPFVLLGGATTIIGDPSFKNEERVLVSEDEIHYRFAQISAQLQKLLTYDNSPTGAVLLNNFDWLSKISVIDFLKNIGKHITINYMKAKDSIKLRMETGISYAEFSYQLFQAYDFYHLYKTYNVTLQMGGADQWGNLTTGIELIRKRCNKEVFALTTPLITKADGTKFGKSEKGTNIWLDPKLVTPYQFYQFWINTTDDDAKRFIKVFTMLPIEEINHLISQHDKSPQSRLLQKTVAEDVTTYVHGKDMCKEAIHTSKVIFDERYDLKSITEEDLLQSFSNVPHLHGSITLANTTTVVDFLSSLMPGKIFASKNEILRLISEQGIYINKSKLTDKNLIVGHLLLHGKYLVVQKGKKNFYLITCK